MKYVKFRIKELFIAVPVAGIVNELDKLPGETLRARRMPLGRGWSLKYLVYGSGRPEPVALIKAASRLIERRLKHRLGPGYAPPDERYRREAEVLSGLAGLGLAPKILLRGENYLVREYSPGRPLAGLPAAETAEFLPRVLGAIDTACAAGIFHSDMNAGNVIITPSGETHFIDSEIPSKLEAGNSLPDNFRSYCHERLIHSLAAGGEAGDILARALEAYYGNTTGGAISPARAVALVTGQTAITEYPG